MSSAWLSVLAKTSVFGTSSRAGEYLRELVAERADDGADLIRVDYGSVELTPRIGGVLLLYFPAPQTSQALSLLDLLVGLELAAVTGPLRIDHIDLRCPR